MLSMKLCDCYGFISVVDWSGFVSVSLLVCFLPLLLRNLLVAMPGPSCERVARCREKSRTRRFAVSQGFLRQPIFATAAASSSLPSHPFQLYHVLPAAQVSVPPTTSE
jgi:hypothetical protein